MRREKGVDVGHGKEVPMMVCLRMGDKVKASHESPSAGRVSALTCFSGCLKILPGLSLTSFEAHVHYPDLNPPEIITFLSCCHLVAFPELLPHNHILLKAFSAIPQVRRLCDL